MEGENKEHALSSLVVCLPDTRGTLRSPVSALRGVAWKDMVTSPNDSWQDNLHSTPRQCAQEEVQFREHALSKHHMVSTMLAALGGEVPFKLWPFAPGQLVCNVDMEYTSVTCIL